MANSRTKVLIPMLALCIFAVSAYGQAVLTLGSNPTRVRAEGITEVVGLITLSNNTNANQIIPNGTSITIVFDGSGITNVPGVSTTCTTGAGACVVVPPDRNIYTTGAGSSLATGLTLVQSGSTITLSITAAYNNTAACGVGGVGGSLCIVAGGSLNIQGVRVNVSGLAGNIFATLTTVPANAITFPGGANATVVGRAQATIGRVDAIRIPSLGQCLINPPPTLNANGTINTGALPTGGFTYGFTGNANSLTNGFTVNITEPSNFPTSFSAASSVGGPYFFDEAGITPAGFQGTSPVPTVGVQFTLTFSNLPTGVVLIAQQQAGAINGGAVTNPGTTIAPGVAGFLVGYVVSSGTTIAPSTVGTSATNYVLLPSSGGAASITYEVVSTGNAATSTSPTTVDTVSIPFLISIPTGQTAPIGSLGGVQASVAPVSTVTNTAGSSLRFAANSGVPATAANIANSVPCLTNLLFPFVSNRTGTTFNTGLAISNTAKDSGTTTGDTGGVTLYFYGISAPTGGSAGIAMPIPSVSAGGTVAVNGVVGPGEHTVLALNDGTATAIASGFQGYIVALCNFRFAHGLATVFDNFGVGAANVGFSYLPLVLTGTTTGGRTGSNNVPGGFPESLGN